MKKFQGRRFRSAYFKRTVDLIFSLSLLVLLSPVLLVAAVFVLLLLGKPIFFFQDRPGLHGKPFRMIKFRTMSNTRDTTGQLLPDRERLTLFGRLLRKTSIDELPELFNVLSGQMSVVGPRPLLMEYLAIYTPEQARRQEVKPGITGLAQISGRQSLAWSQKFKLDNYYVDNWSIWLDLQIMVITPFKIIFASGVKDGESPAEDDAGLWAKVISRRSRNVEKHHNEKSNLITYEDNVLNKYILCFFLKAVDGDLPRRLSEARQLTEYAAHLEKNAEIISAWNGFELVGLCAFYVNDSDNSCAFISFIGVSGDYRGNGIAAELLDRCKKKSQAVGKRSIVLNVHKQNGRAIDCYKKFGFTAAESLNDDTLNYALELGCKRAA